MHKMEKKYILDKLAYMKEFIELLDSRIQKYEQEENIVEKKTLFAAMSKFSEEIVELGIKINNILLEEHKDYSTSYFDSFSKLSNYYDIDDDFLTKLANTTGFRNRVSHEYGSLNETITLKSFHNIVHLYQRYIDFIKSLL